MIYEWTPSDPKDILGGGQRAVSSESGHGSGEMLNM